jgi:hypothetical protein
MAKAFRPGFYVENEYGKKSWMQFPTYTQLKKCIKDFIEQSKEKEIVVFRHRRGEWGEWFEYWRLNHERKPVITKSGWM